MASWYETPQRPPIDWPKAAAWLALLAGCLAVWGAVAFVAWEVIRM